MKGKKNLERVFGMEEGSFPFLWNTVVSLPFLTRYIGTLQQHIFQEDVKFLETSAAYPLISGT
jgi:hypothetical protein